MDGTRIEHGSSFAASEGGDHGGIQTPSGSPFERGRVNAVNDAPSAGAPQGASCVSGVWDGDSGASDDGDDENAVSHEALLAASLGAPGHVGQGAQALASRLDMNEAELRKRHSQAGAWEREEASDGGDGELVEVVAAAGAALLAASNAAGSDASARRRLFETEMAKMRAQAAATEPGSELKFDDYSEEEFELDLAFIAECTAKVAARKDEG